MKTTITLLFALSFLTTCFSQEKFICRNGHIWFYSSTPMENIEAHNHQVTSYIDAKTGDIAFQLLMKSFKFERALMEEHFNENYVESETYPKAEFKGKISNLSEIKFDKPGTYNCIVEGNLTIHGVTHPIEQVATIEVVNKQLKGKSKFNIVPQDYKIEIPSVVKDKFAKSIEVNVDMTYDPMTK